MAGGPSSLALLAATLGLAFGSFANVVAYRVPLGMSVVSPRSRCTQCFRPIANRDNVPVLSWLALRGKCRHCGAAIPIRYALVESVTAVLFVALTLRLGLVPILPAYLVLAAGLVALSSVDLSSLTIPNRVVYPLAGIFAAALTCALAFVPHPLAHVLGAWTASFVVFDLFFLLHIAWRDGMGFGDVRLSGLVGMSLGWFGWQYVVTGIFAAFAFGTLAGIAAYVATHHGGPTRIRVPFAPFLAAGTITAILVGKVAVNWWLGLF